MSSRRLVRWAQVQVKLVLRARLLAFGEAIRLPFRWYPPRYLRETTWYRERPRAPRVAIQRMADLPRAMRDIVNPHDLVVTAKGRRAPYYYDRVATPGGEHVHRCAYCRGNCDNWWYRNPNVFTPGAFEFGLGPATYSSPGWRVWLPSPEDKFLRLRTGVRMRWLIVIERGHNRMQTVYGALDMSNVWHAASTPLRRRQCIKRLCKSGTSLFSMLPREVVREIGEFVT